MSKNKILVIEPNKEPYIKTVQDIDEELINIIGDNLKYIKSKNNTNLVFDDEGKINDLEFNRIIKNDVICGTFVMVGEDRKKDEWTSLTSKQIRYLKKRFQMRHDKALIQFMKEHIKQSSNLLKSNLKGIEKLNKMIVSDRKAKKKGD